MLINETEKREREGKEEKKRKAHFSSNPEMHSYDPEMKDIPYVLPFLKSMRCFYFGIWKTNWILKRKASDPFNDPFYNNDFRSSTILMNIFNIMLCTICAFSWIMRLYTQSLIALSSLC